MRNLPFFVLSMSIHLIALMLITLKFDIDVVKKIVSDKSIVEVELVKDIRVSVNSVINKISEKSDSPKIVRENPKEESKGELSIKNIDLKTSVKVLFDENVPDKSIYKSENIIKERVRENRKEPTLLTKILYVEKGDIKNEFIKSSTNPELSSKEEVKYESSNPFDMKISLKTSDQLAIKENVGSISDVSLTQDYDLVRRLIEEKANRFVPIVYQKKLQEKKKRTAVVELVLEESGYVRNHIIKKSTGLIEMDKCIRAILHLGEPYVFISRPIDIELVFYE